MPDDQNKTPQQPVDLFSVTEVPVTLTYAGLGAPPITFFLRPCLSREEQALRQAMLLLPDKDREAGMHAHNVEMVSRLEVRTPTGIVNYAGSVKAHFGLEAETDPDADMEELNKQQQRNRIKRKVLSDAMTRYYTITQPEEFFRSV